MAREYKQSDLWVVELDELDWYGPNATQDVIRRDAMQQAAIMGCNVVAVLVTPDELFPMCGQNKRHRVFEALIAKPLTGSFKVSTVYSCELNSEEWHEASEKAKAAILRKARDHLNNCGLHVPGRYSITVKELNGQMREVERGRV